MMYDNYEVGILGSIPPTPRGMKRKTKEIELKTQIRTKSVLETIWFMNIIISFFY